MQPLRSRFAAALLVAVVIGLGLPLVAHSVASADGTPNISLTKAAPATVLYGETSTVELQATNGTTEWGYNLSFRDVLPERVSYAPGSAETEPEILVDQPKAGQTTLIWTNVADLAPSNTYTFSYGVDHETDDAATGTTVACADSDVTDDIDDSVLCVGESYTNTAGAYVNDDPRYIPDFDATTGEPITGTTSFTGFAVDDATTEIIPFQVTKDEPNAEGEILRGIHDHSTTYTITVENNLVRPTKDLVLDDYLPAGLEFLGCGGLDNTTDAPTYPGNDVEYEGAPRLTGTPAVASDCIPVSDSRVSVETVEDPAGLPAGVYTHVTWTGLGSIPAGGEYVLTYAAGIPIRENTMDFDADTPAVDGTPATTGAQAANLDNNGGDETADEQELTNFVTATGVYDGGAITTPGATSTDDFDLTRTAEDLSIHKTGSDQAIVQGEVVTWTLFIETSEYRWVEDLVVTDTLPDGLCPLQEGVDFDTSNDPAGECSASDIAGTQDPSIAYATTPVEAADGRWTVTFDDLGGSVAPMALLPRSSSYTITLPTQVRSYYQQNGAYETPVVGRDAWDNEVSITGNDYVICGTADPLCTGSGAKIDTDETDGTPDVDGSSAGQAAAFDQIEKYIAAPVAGGCTDAGVAWKTDADPLLQFRAGDRICYRLTVDFDPDYDTRNPVVDDFIPPNTTYDVGSAVALTGNTVSLDDVDETTPGAGVQPSVVGPRLTWLMGVDAGENACDFGSEDCYAQPGERFDVAFSVTAAADPSLGNDFDLIDNLMKFAAQNTAGTYVPLRDAVSYELIEPTVDLTKAATDTSARVAGGTVDYAVTVTNTGAEAALDVVVWDLLPDEVVCADDVSAVSAGGACEAGVENRIEWTIPSLAATGEAGDSVTLTYTITVPIDVAAGESLDNEAGVRTYESATNLGGRVVYTPTSNIDPTIDADANAPIADDTESVPIAALALEKSVTSLTTQDGNTAGQATIGETVRYTVTLTIPAGTTTYAGSLTDAIDTGSSYLASSTSVAFSDGEGGTTLPAGFTVGDAELTFPATHVNPAASGDDVFTLTFDVTVDEEVGNTRAPRSTIDNTAAFDRHDSLGDAFATLDSNEVSTEIVEPLVTVTKTDDTSGAVAGGDTIVYTITVTNSSADRVSTANDLTIVDTLPAGLTTVAPTDGAGTDAPSTYDAGAPQTLTWNVASLAPGASVALIYQLTVSDDVTAGESYTNDVEVALSSLPGAFPADLPAAERAYTAAADDTVTAVGATLDKSVTPAVRTVGQSSTYTIDVDIPANTRLYDATVVDELPDGLRFDGYGTCSGDATICAALTTLTPAADTPAAGQTRIAWYLGDLAPDPALREISLTYAVEVALTDQIGDVAAAHVLDNIAALGWNGADGATITDPPAIADFGRATATVTATVSVTEPSLTIDKDVSGQVADTDAREVSVDEALTYTVTVTNATGVDVSAAHDITVVDTVPAGVVVDTGSITGGGTYDAGPAQTITWTVAGPLEPGAATSFTYAATLEDSGSISATDTYANTAAIDEYFGVDATERATDPAEYRTYGGPADTVTVTPEFPELTVAKTSTGDAVIGEAFTWTVTVVNGADRARAFGIDLVDTLPANWSYTGSPTLSIDAGAPTDPGAPAVDGQVLTWTDLGDLPAGSTLVLTFQATSAFAARDNADHQNGIAVTGADGDGNDANADGAYADVDTDEPTLVGSSLGDRVWEDLNGNGIQDTDEPGIDGVTVNLYAADGTTILDTTTTGTAGPVGSYSFDLLPAGSYVVEFAQPVGYVPTAVGDGSDPANDSDAVFPDGETLGRTGTIVVPSETDDATIDAGFYRLVDLGDLVWDDLNGNGQFDDGEPPVEGATVTLRDADGDIVGTPQTTVSDGAYRFTDLVPGDYTVTFTAPDGYAITTQNSGDDATDSDPAPDTGVAAVTLVSNIDDLTVDVGLYIGAAIGDRVWFDLDGDGIQDDGEPGAPGVSVVLLDGDGDPIGDPQLTDENGSYLFSGLAPAVYSVRFTAPAGTEFTLAGEGGDVGLDSDVPAGGTTGTTTDTTLTSGETDRTWDAGLVGTGSIGDFVWEDLNGDGVQDDGEPAVEGAIVTLTWAGPDGELGTDDDIEIGSATTVDDGLYGFDLLPPGPYQVDVTAPAGGLVETFDADDPDPDAITTPSSAIVDLAAGAARTDVDFGYQRRADLGITKTVDDGDLLTGETASYTITVANVGPAPAEGPIVVVDTAPVGLTPLTAGSTDTDWICAIDGQEVTCTHPGPLANGDSLTAITTTALVEGDAAASLVNEAAVSAATVDPNPDNDADDAEVTTTQAADLTVDKSHATDSFVVGQPGSYSILVANEGPSTATGTVDAPFTVTDTLPAGLTPTAASGTDWDCTIDGQDVTCTTTGSVADGSSLPVLTITVDVGVAAEGGVINTASVSGGTTVDPNADNDSDDDPTDITPAADLSLTKAAQGPLVQDEEVDYLLTVTNDGPSSAAADIVIVDDLPDGLTYVASASDDGFTCADVAGTVTCTRTTALPAGASAAVTLTLYVEVDGPADITNEAVVSSPTLDPDTDNNSSSGENSVTPQVDLVVDKSHAGDFQVGSQATWLIAVGNNGPSTSTGEITVTDTLPDAVTPVSAGSAEDAWDCTITDQDLTCTITATVGPGGSFPAIEVAVDVLPAAYPSVSNTAVVAGPDDVIDPVEANDTDTDPAAVGALADLALTKTSLDEFVAGETGRYELTVTNVGPNEDPADITVVDTLPTGVTFVSGAGDGWTCAVVDQVVTCTWADGPLVVAASTSLVLTVAFDPSAQPGVENVATVSSPTADPDEDNDTAAVSDDVAPSADLSIAKTSAGNVLRGEDVEWSIVVTNAGPSDDPGPITVTDTVPDAFEIVSAAGEGWDCAIDGQDITCVRSDVLMLGAAPAITVVATAGEGSEGTVENSASVSSDTIDRDPTNDTSTDEVEVIAVVDLGLVKVLDGTSIVAGGSATWILTVSNRGLSPAVNVVVVDDLPPGLGYGSASGDGWSCTSLGQTVTCPLDGDLEPGTSSTLRLTTTVSADLSGPIEQRATVSADGVELESTDNGDLVLASVTRRSTPGGALANTGAGTGGPATVGLALLGLGALLVASSERLRRRRPAGRSHA